MDAVFKTSKLILNYFIINNNIVNELVNNVIAKDIQFEYECQRCECDPK